MIAYLFWHWPHHDVEIEDYERSLSRFHETLAEASLEGFHGSATFRTESMPWAGSRSYGYEDWYLLKSSCVLDPLNEVAVSGGRREPHDKAARKAAGGAGGLYRLESGEPDVARLLFATWITKPAGTGYQDFYAGLEPWGNLPGTSLWRRQMVLGPAPEFRLLGEQPFQPPANLGPVTIKKALIWPTVET